MTDANTTMPHGHPPYPTCHQLPKPPKSRSRFAPNDVAIWSLHAAECMSPHRQCVVPRVAAVSIADLKRRRSLARAENHHAPVPSSSGSQILVRIKAQAGGSVCGGQLACIRGDMRPPATWRQLLATCLIPENPACRSRAAGMPLGYACRDTAPAHTGRQAGEFHRPIAPQT